MNIDYHSHILPGIDDGAVTIEDSLMLAKAQLSWGFDRVYCTPHITADHRNNPETIRPAFEALQEALYKEGCPLEIRMSAECRLVPDTWPEVLEKNWLMPIEDKYILTEFPINKPYKMGWIKPVEEFQKIISMGLTPLLPHPERYAYLSEDDLLRFLDAGAVFQSNYGSLAGLYGEEVRQKTLYFKNKGYISLWGTDLHNAKYVQVLNGWFETNPLQPIA